jgi:hypothetical protein
MGYLLEGLELFIYKVAYTTNDAISFVPWSKNQLIMYEKYRWI